MKLFRILLLLTTLPLLSHATTPTPSFADAKEFIASVPGSDPERSETAEGDLNGDGLNDLAIIVGSGEEYFSRAQQIFVLLQSADGRFVPAVSSQRAEIAGMGCCWVEAFEIRAGSIYIQSNAKTACQIEAATHQFKLYRGAWRLIGLKIINYEHCDSPQVTTEQDTNLLTGRTIFSRQLDERTPKVRTAVRPHPVFLLKEFDFAGGFGLLEK